LKAALLDSSAIVAMFDQSERDHRSVVAALGSWKGALVTVEAVIAESAHLLRQVHGAREAILENVAQDVFQIPFRLPDAAEEVARLLHKYRDQQIDLADACLIHLAGELETGDILTLDHDFEIYRWGRNHSFRMLIGR
jgi:predicted nucleic acid-binding protein